MVVFLNPVYGVQFPTVTVDDLLNCNTIDTGATGILSCGTDESGSGVSYDLDYICSIGNTTDEWITVAGLTIGENINMADDKWIGLSSGSGRIEFDDQSTDEINILNANVGIGTTSPSSMLAVYEASAWDQAYVPLVNITNLDSNAIDSYGLLVRGGANNVAGLTFQVQDYSGNTDFVIGGNGKVGIGTASPNFKVEWADATRNGFLDFGLGGVAIGGATGNTLTLWTNGTQQVTIDTSGNVGIGDATPDFDLTVKTGSDFGIGATQWNSSDEMDGTKIKDADYGDVVIDAAGDWQVSEATALAANGGNCAAGQYPLGVDASGAIENCTDATTEINSVVNGLGGTNLTCAAQSCNVDDKFVKNDASDTMGGTLTADGITIGQDEYLTMGTNTISHDGTNFVMGDDLDFAKYKAIAMICDNGATAPTCDTAGQWFLHTPTGRNILMMCDGSNWINIVSLEIMTVYVDATDGSDAIDQGGGVDGDAFETITYAVNRIPGAVGGNVYIYINDETYAESVYVKGKTVAGSYNIYLSGTLTSTDTGTCGAGSVQGSGATQGLVVDNTGGWGVNDYQNLLLKFDDATSTVALRGDYVVIDSNGASSATVVGTMDAAPAIGDTFTVYDWGTIITNIYIQAGQKAIVLENLKTSNRIRIYNHSEAIIRRVWATSAGSNGIYVYPFAYITISYCYLEGLAGLNVVNGYALAYDSKISGNGSNYNGVILLGGYIQLSNGTIVDDWDKNTGGVNISRNGTISFSASSSAGYVRIRECGTFGVYALTGGQGAVTANIQYLNNGTDESAVAASFGYID